MNHELVERLNLQIRKQAIHLADVRAAVAEIERLSAWAHDYKKEAGFSRARAQTYALAAKE